MSEVSHLTLTELIQIANDLGYEGSTRQPREHIEAFVLGVPEKAEDDSLHAVRVAIYNYIQQYIDTVRGQLTCDADCFSCPEAMVASCWVKNKHTIR